jgi:translocation and assembly module TamB
VDHLAVGVQIESRLRQKWYLSDIVINHPVARVLVDENGNTNLPKSKSDQSTSVFDLGIRHVMLGQGEVYYNDRKSVLDADLHDVEFQSSFDAAKKQYSGGLSYKNGQIHLQDLNPMVHSLEAEFDATPDTFNLKRSTLTSGASQVSLTATLNDYVHPKVTGTYQAELDTGELRQILKDATLPVGVVKLNGSGQFQSDPDKTVLETLRLDGNMATGALQIHTTTINTQVRDISAQYSLLKGDVDVRNLHARVLGGTLDGTFTMHDLADAQQSEFHAVVHNVALSEIQTLADPATPPAKRQFRLGGTANANVDARWHKAFNTLIAHTDANLKGNIAPNKGNSNVAVDGDIHAEYSAATEEVSFTRSYLRMPQTFVNLNGTVSERSSLQVQFQSNDLSEVEAAADVFGLTPEPLGLYGAASFSGTVRGSTTAPLIAGQLSGAALKVKGTEWQTLRTTIDASPSHLILRNGDLRTADSVGRITFNVNLGLDHWAFNDTSPMQVDLNASQLDLAELKSLAGSQAPVTGTLAADISLSGSQLSLAGKGTINLTQATIADEPIQSASVNFQGTGDEVRGRLAVRMAAGNAQGDVTYFPKRKAYDGQVQATGIRLDQLRALQARNIQAVGTLDLNAKGSGTVDDPAVEFTAKIPQLQVQDQTINGVTLQANIANHVADFALDSQALNTFVRGKGKVNLTGDYFADATVDTSTLSLQPLLAIYLPAYAADLNGQTELHATLRGPLTNQSVLDAHVTLPTLSLAYKDKVQLAAAEPIQVDYAKGVVSLQKAVIRGTGTDLQLQGTFPVTGSAPIALVALGTIDLKLAQMFDPDITSSGQIQFDINGSGQPASPNVRGQVKIVNASFAGDDLPLGLQNGNGVFNLTGDRLEIEQFQGSVSGGTLTAKGGVIYRPSVQFNLALAANGIRMLYPQGVREGVDTNLTMTGTMQSATLRGQVRLNELSFSPTFDLAEILGEVAGTTTVPPQGFARNLNLDVTVQSTNDLNLASSKLSLEGAANLRVRGTAAEPVVLGRLNLTAGDLIFRGNRYILLPSTLDFVNPYKIEPRVNLAVQTKVQEYNVQLLFRGPIDQLRTTYSSEPALPPADIINLLVFGKTTEAAEANPTPGNLGAESLIASSVSSQVTSRIEKIAGISQLSIDPVLGGNQQDPGARVTIQQRVTGNLFVTFATDATSTQRQVIKLEYQATPRLALSGVRDQNGGFAVDVKIRKTW